MKRTFTTVAALALLTGWCGLSAIGAEAPAPAEKPARVDLHGDTLPDGALVRLGTLRWRHSGWVLFTAYLKDGNGVLTASQDGTIRVWAPDGKEIRRFGTLPNQGQPRPAGQDRDGVERQLRAYPMNTLQSVALSADRTVLATGAQNQITLWDVETGKEIRKWTGAPNGALGLTFSPDGTRIACKSYDQAVYVYTVADGKQLRRFAVRDVQKEMMVKGQQADQLFFGGQQVSGLHFSPDGRILYAVGMRFEVNQFVSLVKRWEMDTGTQLKALTGPTGGFQTVEFSPDGNTLAWGINDGSLRLWDLGTGKETKQVGGQQAGGFVSGLGFSPDAKFLAARHQDQTLRLWNVATGKEERQVVCGYGMSNLGFTADGKHIVSGTNGNTIRQFDLTSGKELASEAGHHGPIATLGLSADGKTAITRSWDNLVHVWDATTGKPATQFQLPPTVQLVAVSRDAKTLVAASYDGTLRTWDVATGKEAKEWKAHQNGFMSLALSPDGKTIASRSYDQTIRLWEARTGQEVRQIAVANIDNGPALAFAAAKALRYDPTSPMLVFSPDGSLLAGMTGGFNQYRFRGEGMVAGGSNSLVLWDVGTGKQLRKFEASPKAIVSFTFSPDGLSLAAGHPDGFISLWEAASGKLRFEFKAGNTQVQHLAYSPSGKVLLASDVADQSTLRFWNAVTGKALRTITTQQGSVTTLAFSADGKRLLSGGNDTTALMWDPTGAEADIKPPQPVELDEARTDALWRALCGDNAKEAYQAVLTLNAGSKQALPMLVGRVKAIPAPDAKHVAKLIADLDNNQFATRQKATEELERMGELAGDALQKALAAGPPLEIRTRVERLLERLVDGKAPPAEMLQTMRALEVLQEIGTPEARAVVETVAGGAQGSRVTRMAQTMLQRMPK